MVVTSLVNGQIVDNLKNTMCYDVINDDIKSVMHEKTDTVEYVILNIVSKCAEKS